MTSKQREIADLEKQVKELEGLRGVLGDEITDQKVAELEARLSKLRRETQPSIGSSTVVGPGGDIPSGRKKIDKRVPEVQGPQTNISGGEQRGPVLSGEFSGPVDLSTHHHGTPPIDDRKAEETYRKCIAERCGVLPLQSLEVSPTGGDAKPLSLAQVYISLDTRQSAAVEIIEAALAEAAQGKLDGLPEFKASDREAERERETRAVSGLEAAILNPCLVLTGEPGSGKSTFVNHLTYAMALRQWECLLGWPEREHNALPVLVMLRKFARWVSTKRRDERSQVPEASASLLWDYITHGLEQRRLGAATSVLEKALEDGRAIVLLDGLDEVPADDAELLGVVKTSVRRFIERYKNSRHLVTCRVLSYREPSWDLSEAGFPDLELARFTEEKIDQFIDAWYREVGAKWKLSSDETDTLAGKLRQAVRRPDLWRLAPNPLLLTVMALVHSRRRELPEKRALLYDEAVDILLQRREQETLDAPRIRELLDEAGLDFNDLKSVLERLAFETHASGRTVRDAEDAGPIEESTLRNRVAALNPKMSYDWSGRLLEALRLRASLLLERTGEVYSFPHRTFQEYLAGVYLARLDGDEFAERAVELVGEQLTYWREVVLLAVGYLVHKNRDASKPRLLADELCPEQPPEGEEGWRKAWLAGDVLREAGAHRIGSMKHGKRLLERVRERLIELVEQGALSARERAEAGDVLGELGDPRFDPDFFYLPCRYRGEPEPLAGFVEITSGAFVMGEDNERQNLSIDYPYWIARYPVTVDQYSAFVEAEGYENEAFWTETAWEWRWGRWDSQVEDEYWRGRLKSRPAKLRDKPMGWNEQRAVGNRPVVGLSWFEAVAYCRWLDEVLRGSGKVNVLQDGKYILRLATEGEWEKAARCGDARKYPWGDDDWDEERANIGGSEIGHPTPVGMYPKGVAVGTMAALHDLSGNVWEWTLSLYRDYPYRPEDGRNDPNVAAVRVVRGGSCRYAWWESRCASRGRAPPDVWGTGSGFRVVLSLADSGF